MGKGSVEIDSVPLATLTGVGGFQSGLSAPASKILISQSLHVGFSSHVSMPLIVVLPWRQWMSGQMVAIVMVSIVMVAIVLTVGYRV